MTSNNNDFLVAPEFRTNPLSHIYAPQEVHIEKGTRTLIYNNIHYPNLYLDAIRNTSSMEDSYESSTIEDLVDLYGGDPSNMSDDEMDRFLDSQMPDYD
jgi:hypothetical protein